MLAPQEHLWPQFLLCNRGGDSDPEGPCSQLSQIICSPVPGAILCPGEKSLQPGSQAAPAPRPSLGICWGMSFWGSFLGVPMPFHQGAADQPSPSLLAQLLPGNFISWPSCFTKTNILNLSDCVSTSHENNPALEKSWCAYSRLYKWED